MGRQVVPGDGVAGPSRRNQASFQVGSPVQKSVRYLK
jgi:hypothetical protein